MHKITLRYCFASLKEKPWFDHGNRLSTCLIASRADSAIPYPRFTACYTFPSFYTKSHRLSLADIQAYKHPSQSKLIGTRPVFPSKQTPWLNHSRIRIHRASFWISYAPRQKKACLRKNIVGVTLPWHVEPMNTREEAVALQQICFVSGSFHSGWR